jgi:surfeit locus 1 family protein
LAAIGFAALGAWQLERLNWKLDLIATVDARVKAPASALPPPDDWPTVNATEDEYKHVVVTGQLLNRCETLVQALTELGGGYWVMTPLQTAQGTVLVNRGFVPSDKRDPATRATAEPEGSVTVTGLLRMSEPGGGFLRPNDPKDGRWYSRDVAEIAGACGLDNVAPFFVDADATPNPGGYPVGGLTVINFSNNHFVYALTWFGLALLSAAGSILVLRSTKFR